MFSRKICITMSQTAIKRRGLGTIGVLSAQQKDFRVVHGSRISHDWKWRSNVLGVFKAHENQSLTEIINLVIHNYELDKKLLRVTCSKDPDDFSPLKAFLDVKEKLREWERQFGVEAAEFKALLVA
uniref:DUF4476 domain-containing protein n=1 Tax=Heterorhabditis bacteriophora TaxID=37862 RepID=A0A1I7XKR6_HETBA